ncbi:alpha/beta hydrolase [Prescottella soli]|uniref:Alpha/beta hydrolase n=1 Tax=Prescottella soli TaxID=1543852 RepID=A0ABW9FY50_9NOCA
MTVTLASGRVLAGAAFGPESASPVLFVAGAGTGKSMCFGVDQLGPAGLRLLTMDRPGMGGSSPDEGRSVASTAQDYRAFVSSVTGMRSPHLPVVANSQGALFGLAIAAAGWASSLTLVSPADEVAYPAIHDMLPPEATRLSDMVRDDPQAATEMLGSFTAEAMENMVLAGSDQGDRAFYLSASFNAMYRTALAEGFAGNAPGYVRDTLMAMAPWPVDLGSIACPVRILFGAEDRVHSPDLGEMLSARIPTAVRQVIHGEGGSLLWTRPELTLAPLAVR